MWVQAVSVGGGVVCGMRETTRLVRVSVCVCVCACGVESPPQSVTPPTSSYLCIHRDAQLIAGEVAPTASFCQDVVCVLFC